jgi:hypothetical protein
MGKEFDETIRKLQAERLQRYAEGAKKRAAERAANVEKDRAAREKQKQTRAANKKKKEK